MQPFDKGNGKWYTAYNSFGVNKEIHEWILKIVDIQSKPRPRDHLYFGICTSTQNKNTSFLCQ